MKLKGNNYLISLFTFTMDYVMSNDNSEHRTEKEIKDLLKHAKINEADLTKPTQCIYFNRSKNLQQFRLLEINDELVRHLESGEKLTVKSTKEDFAVVCTQSKTYSVKEAEITNSLLILSNLETSNSHQTSDSNVVHQKVVGVRRSYWELREEPVVKLNRLQEMLSENMYCGPEKENDDARHRGKKYTLKELLDEVPASECQIIDALKSMPVVSLNGYCRLLDFDYITRLLTEIVNFIEENSWSWREVDRQTTLTVLAELEPVEILQKWFEIYADKNENKNTWCLNESKICQLYAQILLHSVEKFHLRDFTSAWEESVPVGMKPNFSMLQGLAIVEKNSKPPFIQNFPVGRLPEETSERFEKLFRVKQKWTLDEITPYVQNLVTSKAEVGSLLMKYCRCSIVGDVKYYTSKHMM